jgi:ribokinase
MHLTICGVSVVDVIFPRIDRLPVWPRHTEFTLQNLVMPSAPPVVTLGGNGANAAYVAARCGAHVTLHTCLGRDPLGGLARGWLESAGCRISGPQRVRSTAVNVTAANARHRRATLFYPGRPPELPSVGASARREAMLVCGWPHPPLPEVARRFRVIARAGGLTALDTGPILGRPWSLTGMRPLWPHLRMLLTNEFELLAITKARTVAGAISRVRSVYDGDVVIKRGPKGVVHVPAGSCHPRRRSAIRVRAVNTVGAGDAFNGALLASLCQGRPMEVALGFAGRVAASVVASPSGVLGARCRP